MLKTFTLYTESIKVEFTGMKHVACKKLANYAWVSFRKHCLRGYFSYHQLSHLHY